MRNVVKIIILALSFAGVSTLILIFINSILTPPTSIKLTNQFKPKVEGLIANFGNEANGNMELDVLNTRFFDYVDLTSIYKENSLLNSTELSSMTEDFLSKYNPEYAKSCSTYFTHPFRGYWDEKILKDMNERLSRLKSMSPKLYQNNQNLHVIARVLDDYNDARSLSYKKWENIYQSESNRRKTNEYLNDDYLKYNHDLCNRLEAAMKRQGQGHYNHLRSRVDRLNYYRDYRGNKEGYDKLSQAVMDEIDVYAKNAESIYGEIISVESIRNDAAEYDLQAQNYFEIFN